MRYTALHCLIAVLILSPAVLCAASDDAAPISAAPAPSASSTAAAAADRAALEQLDFANGLFTRKMYAMAMDEYGKFAAAYPGRAETPRAYFMTGESLFYLGRYREAIAAYDDYLKRFPGDTDAVHARLRIIASAVELKDCARALEDVTPYAADGQPAEIRGEALYLMALAKLSCGDKAEAVRILQAATGLGKASSYAAVASYQLGRIRREEKDLAGAAEDFDTAAAIALDGETRAVAVLGAAEARLDLGSFKEASALLSALVSGKMAPSETKDRAVLGLVRAQFELGEYADAVESYRKAQADLRSPSLRMQAALFAAQAYSRLGRDTDALNLIDITLTDASLTPAERETVVFAKVAAFIVAKRFEEARSLLAAQPSYDDAARALFLRAEVDYYLKSYADARKGYDEFLRAYPDSPLRSQALYGMAYAALDNADKAVARDVFLRLATDFPDDPKAAKALYAAAVLEGELGKGDEGIGHAKAYLERYGSGEDAKEALLLLGRLFSERGKPAEAIRTYEDYLRLYPADGKVQEVYFHIGRNYQASGDTKASSDYFSKVTKDAGGEDLYFAARQNMAQNYVKEKDELQAAREMDGVLADYAKTTLGFETYLWVARTYIDAKLYDDALRVLSLSARHADAAANAAAVTYYRSEAARGLGRYDEALGGYAECVQGLPDGAARYAGPAYLGAGLCRLAKNEPEAARQAFEDAIAADPADNTVVMRARYHLADLLSGAGKLDEAAKTYMMVAILYDDTTYVPQALYKAIAAFEKLGRKAETEKACKDFLTRFPGDEKAAAVREALNRVETISR